MVFMDMAKCKKIKVESCWVLWQKGWEWGGRAGTTGLSLGLNGMVRVTTQPSPMSTREKHTQ